MCILFAYMCVNFLFCFSKLPYLNLQVIFHFYFLSSAAGEGKVRKQLGERTWHQGKVNPPQGVIKKKTTFLCCEEPRLAMKSLRIDPWAQRCTEAGTQIGLY